MSRRQPVIVPHESVPIHRTPFPGSQPAHRWVLLWFAHEQLMGMRTGRVRDEAFRAILRGDAEGVVCFRCGITLDEYHSYGQGNPWGLECQPRPRVIQHYLLSRYSPRFPGMALYSAPRAHPRREEISRREIGESLLEAVQVIRRMPVLVTDGRGEPGLMMP